MWRVWCVFAKLQKSEIRQRRRDRWEVYELKGVPAILVLSRKLGEKICIGDNITLVVVDIDRGKIRLGVEAPRDVPVFRKELMDRDGGVTKPLPSQRAVLRIPNEKNGKDGDDGR